jgi:hypothetical protein
MLWDALPKEDSHLCLIATRQLSALAGKQVAGSPQTRSRRVPMPGGPAKAILALHANRGVTKMCAEHRYCTVRALLV